MRFLRIIPLGKVTFLWLILGVCSTASMSVPAQDQGLNQPSVSASHSVAIDFLETLAWPESPSRVDGFNANNAPHWNLEKVMSYLGDDIEFADVNDNSDVHLKKVDIKKQLAARHGKAFDVFAHLSYIYSQHSKDSELIFKDSPNKITVDMSGWYIFTFTCIGNKPYLTSVNYTQLEGD